MRHAALPFACGTTCNPLRGVCRPNTWCNTVQRSRPISVGGCLGGRGTQARRLSSCPRHRSSFLRREELLLPPALDITTGWCRGRFRGFSDLPDARAAACLSHISFDLTHMSSICSWTQEVSPAALQGSVNPPKSGSHLSSTALVS